MADQPTCGQGLAERSALPAKLGELAASLADNLEVHTRALDLSEQNAKEELAVYQKLVQQHRAIAAQLETVGEDMAGYHDLPMAKHDLEAMSSNAVVTAFDRYVKVEQELLGLLERRVEEDQAMLVEMRRAAA
jgi:short-subunit dehydrogenase involved in D-alanine esterification of teichoic acids